MNNIFISMLFHFYSLSTLLSLSLNHSRFILYLVFLFPFSFLSTFSRSQQESYCALNVYIYIFEFFFWNHRDWQPSHWEKKDNRLNGYRENHRADWFYWREVKKAQPKIEKQTNDNTSNVVVYIQTLISVRVLCVCMFVWGCVWI